MTIQYLDKLHQKKLETKQMTREWMHRFTLLVRKLKRGKDDTNL